MIISDGILGTKALSIIMGSSTTAAKSGHYLATQNEIGMLDKLGDAGAKVDPLLSNVDGAVTDAKTALRTIEATVANFNTVVDAQTKASVQKSVTGLETSVRDFNALSAELAAQRQKISSTVTSLETFAKNLNANNGAINASLVNVQKTTEQLANADITTAVENLKRTLGQLELTIGKINSTDGSVGMLMNDKKLYNDLQGSLHSLDALLADMKANPHRYVSFSLIQRKAKPSEPASAEK
jgi:phospholipid/cholesterol/gamma-HCH transport system substrate-binding protein